jgi:hypothetical protein
MVNPNSVLPPSKLLLVYLPFAIALAAYCLAFWSNGFLKTKPIRRIVTMLICSFLAALFSFWIYMEILIAMYGE